MKNIKRVSALPEKKTLFYIFRKYFRKYFVKYFTPKMFMKFYITTTLFATLQISFSGSTFKWQTV